MMLKKEAYRDFYRDTIRMGYTKHGKQTDFSTLTPPNPITQSPPILLPGVPLLNSLLAQKQCWLFSVSVLKSVR